MLTTPYNLHLKILLVVIDQVDESLLLLIANIPLYREVMGNFVFFFADRKNIQFHHEFGSIFSIVNCLTVKNLSSEISLFNRLSTA